MQDKWQVIFYKDNNGDEPVKDFILRESLKARAEIIHVFKLLSKYNIMLGMPYVKKVDKSGLRELRIRHASDSYRICFFAHKNNRLVLLHAFKKKTTKIPQNEIKIALKRMKDYLAGNVDNVS
jgi:phage-related protein